MPRGGRRRRLKSSLRFSSAKALKRSRMVRTRSSSLEDDEDDIARVLHFDHVAREQELETIPETMVQTPIQMSLEKNQQLEICEDDGSDFEDEMHDQEVNHCPCILPLPSILS
jgi:hypothetical protein